MRHPRKYLNESAVVPRGAREVENAFEVSRDTSPEYTTATFTNLYL